MEALLPLMNMVIYSIDKAKKFRLNREVSPYVFTNHLVWSKVLSNDNISQMLKNSKLLACTHFYRELS